MKISFIIVNYQSEKYLKNCLASIREKICGLEYETIVVNNDKQPLRLSGKIKVIDTGKNIGFGSGCNIGAGEAQGEVLCFLNPDTEIIGEDIIKLIQELEKKEDIAIIGPRLINGSGKTQKWIAGKEITITSILFNNLGYKHNKKIWENEKPTECDWVTGAAMFMRKDVFQKIGGFDESFFMYFEDVDLCKRARQAGYKILYHPDFRIKHWGGRSFFDKKKQKMHYYKSQLKYLKKSLFG